MFEHPVGAMCLISKGISRVLTVVEAASVAGSSIIFWIAQPG